MLDQMRAKHGWLGARYNREASCSLYPPGKASAVYEDGGYGPTDQTFHGSNTPLPEIQASHGLRPTADFLDGKTRSGACSTLKIASYFLTEFIQRLFDLLIHAYLRWNLLTARQVASHALEEPLGRRQDASSNRRRGRTARRGSRPEPSDVIGSESARVARRTPGATLPASSAQRERQTPHRSSSSHESNFRKARNSQLKLTLSLLSMATENGTLLRRAIGC